MNSRIATRLFFDSANLLPRFREAGDITLDLFHRDGRVDDTWLVFPPREFDLLWRLAQTPGERVSTRQLLVDVWRVEHGEAENRVSVCVSSIRTRIEPFGLGNLIVEHPGGAYSLNAPTTEILFMSEVDG